MKDEKAGQKTRSTAGEMEDARWRLECILEGTGIGTWAWNVQTGEVTVGKTWASLVGYTPEELQPVTIETWRTLTHPDDLMRSDSLVLRHFAGELARYDCECRMRHKQGHWVWIQDRGRVTTWKDGRPLMMFGTHTDISDRKRLESVMEARLRLLQARPGGTLEESLRIVIDEAEALTGSTVGFYHMVNADQLSLTLQTWSTNTTAKMCQSEGAGQHYPVSDAGVWVDCVRERRPVIHNDYASLPHRRGLPEGHAPVVRELVVPVLRDGLIVGLLGVGNKPTDYEESDAQTVSAFGDLAWDITELRRAEEERRRIEAQYWKLQKSESLSCLAGAVAHHFNNQLQAVLGNLELSMYSVEPDSEVRGFLADGLTATQVAAELSALMLTYLGQMPEGHESLDLAEVCRQNLPVLQAGLKKGAVLEFDLPSRGPMIAGSVTQIQQVLANIVSNACESNVAAKSVIRVCVKSATSEEISNTHRFPVDWDPVPGIYACLEVGDSGEGIPAKDLDKIFDPFFSSKFMGRGMGLSVVLGIARTHGGCITVFSKQNVGSIFRVYFPTGPVASKSAPPVEEVAPELRKGGTLLVVDDQKMLRTLAEGILKRMGYSVLSAEDGVEAVELFREHQDKITGVLCDMSMPRMDGLETLSALRELSPGLPFILASGYSEEEVLQGIRDEKPHAFLSKPYRREQLCEALRLALGTQVSSDGERG